MSNQNFKMTIISLYDIMTDLYDKPSVERLVAGSTHFVGFSVLAGVMDG